MTDFDGIAEPRRMFILRACCFCDADETFKNTNAHRYCLGCETKRQFNKPLEPKCAHVKRTDGKADQ